MKNTPTYTEEIDWKGKKYVLDLYESSDLSNLSEITQASAVCFDENDNVVLYKHVDGYNGLPGGTLEKKEDPKEALIREIMEESTCEVLDCGLFGYFKIYPSDKSDDTFHHLRYWAKVKCLPETPDPDGKAMCRVMADLDKAPDVLGWGERGKILINLAHKAYKNK